MILVLAEVSDRLAVDLMARLEHSGIAVHSAGPDNWNALRFSSELPGAALGYVIYDDRHVALGELSGVLVRVLPAVPAFTYTETDDDYQLLEWSAALQGFLRALPCRVINRPRPGWHFGQPLLCAFAPRIEKAGFRLPDMLVTSLPEDARNFLQRHAAVLVVPPEGESHVAEAVPGKLPACLIALPDGPQHRIVVVGRQAFGAAAIPDRLAGRCVAAAGELGLEFAVFTIASNPDGDWLIGLDDFPGLDDWPAAGRDAVIGALADSFDGSTGVILVLGGLVDSVVGHVVHRLTDRKIPFLMFDPRQFGQTWTLGWERRSGAFHAWITHNGAARTLDDLRAIYVHELAGESRDAAPSPREVRWLLNSFVENIPVRVANRSSANATNHSKPWQQQAIAVGGFATPRTLVTNSPDAAREFYQRCKRRVIYKSISARRSIVKRMSDADLERLALLASGPVQFQEWLPGADLRVHVMGRRVYATEIDTEATDYRYSGREEKTRQMHGVTLPDDIAERCVRLTRDLGLISAGVDLRRTPAGQYFCFEVNARPAFSFYEQHTGQRIADGLIDALLE